MEGVINHKGYWCFIDTNLIHLLEVKETSLHKWKQQKNISNGLDNLDPVTLEGEKLLVEGYKELGRKDLYGMKQGLNWI